MAVTPKVLLKRSSVVGRVPSASDLQYGEIAINFVDGKIYYKDASNNVKAFIDSARVQAIAANEAGNFLDSAEAIALIDSAYIQLRQSYDYNSLTNKPNILDSADVLALAYDSGETQTLIFSLIDSSYIRSIQSYDADTLDGQDGTYYLDWTNVTNKPNLIDSALTLQLIDSSYIKNTIDSSYISVNINQTTIENIIDATYINNNIDSALIQSIINQDYITNTIDSSVIIRIVNENVLDSSEVTDLIDSDYLRNRVRHLISSVDQGGDGSFSYNQYTGVMTYTGPSAAEVRAHLVAGAGVTYDSATGVISGPTFGNDYIDSATVLDIITREGLDSDLVIALVDSAYIALRDRFQDSSLVTSTVDATYIQARQDYAYGSLTGVPTNVSTFTNDANYLDSTTVQAFIDSAYVNLRADQYNNFDTDFAAKSTTDLSEGSNLYYTKARADSDIAASLNDSGNTVNITINNTITDTVDSAYVLARVAEAPFLDSADAIQLIDSAYVQARQTTGGTVDSASVISLITNNSTTVTSIDSHGALALIDSVAEADFAYNNITHDVYFATSLNPIFTVSHSLTLNAGAGPNYDQRIVSGSGGGGRVSPFQTITIAKTSRTGNLRIYGAIHSVASLNATFPNSTAGWFCAYQNNVSILIPGETNRRTVNALIIAQTTGTFVDNGDTTKTAPFEIKGIMPITGPGSVTDPDDGTTVSVQNNFYAWDSTLSDTNYVFNHSGASWGLFPISASSVNYPIWTRIDQDSAFVTSIIDSAYIQARQTIGGTVDSAATISLIEATVDSAYIELRRPAETIFNVVNNGASAYTFSGDGFSSGRDNPTIYLIRGKTYKFNMAVSGHPFQIRVSSGGAAYNTGVTNNGAQTGDIFFTPDMNAPSSLVYQCTIHGGMVGDIVILDDTTGGLDSASIIQLIDSAYVQSREGSGGGGGSGSLDSGNIDTIVDSAYIKFRVDYDTDESLQFGKDQYALGTLTGSTSGTNIYSAFNPGQADGLFTSAYNYADGGVDIDQWVWGYYWVNSGLGYAQIATKSDNGDGTYTYTTSPALSWAGGWTNNVVLADRPGGKDTPLKIRYNGSSDAVEFNAKKQIRIYHSDESDRPLWINASYLDLNGSPAYFSNRFDSNSLFPSATAYPGMIATYDSNITNGPGGAFVSLEGEWLKISGSGIDSGEAKKIVLDVIDSDHFIPGKGERNWNITSAAPPEISTGDFWLDRDDLVLSKLTASSAWTTTLPSGSFSAEPGLTSQNWWANGVGGSAASFNISGGPVGSFQRTFLMGTSPYNSGGRYTFSNPVALSYFNIGNTASGHIYSIGYTDGSYMVSNAGINGSKSATPSSYTWYNYDNTSMGHTVGNGSGTINITHPNGTLAEYVIIGRNTYGTRGYSAYMFFAGGNTWQRVGEIYDSSDIKNLIDSAYINSKVTGGGGGGAGGGLDSAAVLSLIDSNYIATATGANAAISQTHFHFTADSGQTIFSGADDDSATLSYTANGIMVFLNGILLVDSVDYTALDGSTVTLLDSATSDDVLSIVKMSGSTSTGTDSASVIALVDSAYIQLRDRFQDSAGVIQLVDSSLVQLKAIGLDYNVLSNAPTSLANIVEDTTPQLGGPLDANGNDIFLDDDDFIGWGSVGRTRIIGKSSTLYSTNHITFNVRSASSQATEIAKLTFDDGIYTTIGLNLANWNTALNDYYDLKIKGPTSNSLSANETIRFPESSGTVALTKDLLDSADVTSLIDSAYIQARQTAGGGGSAITIQDEGSSLSTAASTINFVGSGVTASGTGSTKTITITGGGGGGGGGIDSAAVITLIDSDYIGSKVDFTRGEFTTQRSQYTATAAQTVFNHSSIDATHLDVYLNGVLQVVNDDYTANTSAVTFTTGVDSGYSVSIVERRGRVGTQQGLVETKYYFTTATPTTTITGADDNGVTLDYSVGGLDVYLNGILLKDSDDYSTNAGTTVTFVGATDSNDLVTLVNRKGIIVSPNVKNYEFTATAGQTAFSGNDINGNTLSYASDAIQVHMNGILLRAVDYTATNGSSINLATAASLNDELVVSAFSNPGHNMDLYKFTADSGQTIFHGNDIAGAALAYNPGNIQVFMNGLLLNDSDDYIASNGISVTLTSGADASDEIKVASFVSNSNAIRTNAWSAPSGTPVTAAAGDKLFIDTSSAKTVTLPSSASMGDEIRIIDVTGNASSNNITVSRNGHKIQGGTTDLTINLDRAGIGLVYYNVAQGWVLIEN